MKLSLSNLSRLLLFIVGLLGTTCRVSIAQVTSDNTVNTLVNQNGNVAEITGGETRGNNLFHSFQEFSVPTGNEAFFDNANDISNIFSRVTGGNISNIEGEISANGSASLFLINPAGIIFGEGASLNIGGSFYGSSASSILFENGEFSAADLDSPPLLTVNAPIGLSFRDNPGDIQLNPGSQLGISSGETLALIGGDVSLDSAIAFGGSFVEVGSTIELGGLTEAGIVELNNNGSLGFPDNINRGDVSLVNNSILNTLSAGEGQISINSQNFKLTTDSLIFNGVVVDSDTDASNLSSGSIKINATEDVLIDGANSDQVTISNSVFTSSGGQAGSIEISAKNILLLNSGFIDSEVLSQGRTSDIILTAKEDIVFKGRSFFQSGVFNSLDFGSGDSGKINIKAANLSVEDGAAIESGLSVIGDGNGGNINLEIDSLSINKGGKISTTVSGTANGGNVDITANAISIEGNLSAISSEILFPEIEDFDSVENVSNSAGDINILTNSLSITNGARLEASTQSVGDGGNIQIVATEGVLIDGGADNQLTILQSNTGSFFNSFGSAKAGNIEITTPKLSVINNASISASTFNDGKAGDIILKASELLEVSNGGFVGADVFFNATGDGGNLTIETTDLKVDTGGQISVTTRGEGNAGNLTIFADDSIEVTGSDEFFVSGLFATALDVSGNGGEVNIFTQNLNVANGATINVGNFTSSENSLSDPGTGESGNLNIQANSIKLEGNGSITAATQSSTGQGANITLQVAEDITLRDGGLISAQAINEGNGGNLNIDTNFIVAFPDGNSDIIASAQQGQGGNITINADSLLGIEERPLSDLTNDINASSEFSLDGSITINTPDINPIQGTVELPSDIVVPEQTSAQACQANREIAAQNGFTISGKGGVPPAPELPFASQNVYVEDENKTTDLSPIPEAMETSSGKIQPARGIKVTQSGIILTAYRTNDAGDRLPEIKFNCGRNY
ncbi:MAG: filamentous hemagglutinin N-terminal domain-containing protein [Cyanobacteria bacterium P01_G01_bin.39]